MTAIHLAHSITLRDGTGGDDTVQGTSSADTLHGYAGDDLIFGQDGADRLYGGAGDDFLVAGDGRDRLVGCRGDDGLRGGRGADRFLGGLGSDSMDLGDDHARDKVIYRTADQSLPLQADSIDSFESSVDRLNLSRLDADASTIEDDSFVWIGSGEFTNSAGQLRYESGILQADLDGDGSVDFQVFFSERLMLDQADIVL